MTGGSTISENCGTLCSYIFEYKTPKLVIVRSVPLGILRIVLAILLISFILSYKLWYARGYQEFADVESTLTTKIKGFSM